MEFVIRDNRIFFTRAGETGVVSVPAEGCIRFQATASPENRTAGLDPAPEGNAGGNPAGGGGCLAADWNAEGAL